jgi:AGCS family alanine or glycine:cation symporter
MLIRFFCLLWPSWTLFAEAATAGEENFFLGLENIFVNYLVNPASKVLFYNVAFFSEDISLPFVVVWLISGAIFLTIKMGFINIRAFKHAIDVTRGKYDRPSDPGEINHFQALASALAATLGLGNIAGVSVAVAVGGPGAVLWMIFAGFFGMTAKMVECTLAVKYRHIDQKGQVLGGPMRYISAGFAEHGFPKSGKTLAAIFGIMCIGGSLGGGNMFQANQAYASMAAAIPALQGRAWLFGLILASFVAMVIIGGIKRISSAASFIVPLMCIIYLVAGTWILIDNYEALPQAFLSIWNGAFNPAAGYGGLMGVMITGMRRASFSNEAGIGSAAIAHAAVVTTEPVREGIVALLEPFIDTIVVCTMTGLIVVVTGAYQNSSNDGILIASAAFKQTASWLPLVLSIVVLLFAFATMISWSYYGERCWSYLFKTNNTMPYKIIYVFFSFLGAVFALGPVLEFSDLMILGMGFPNIFAIVILSPKVKIWLDDYWERYKSGSMVPEKIPSSEEESLGGGVLSK